MGPEPVEKHFYRSLRAVVILTVLKMIPIVLEMIIFENGNNNACHNTSKNRYYYCCCCCYQDAIEVLLHTAYDNTSRMEYSLHSAGPDNNSTNKASFCIVVIIPMKQYCY